MRRNELKQNPGKIRIDVEWGPFGLEHTSSKEAGTLFRDSPGHIFIEKL